MHKPPIECKPYFLAFLHVLHNNHIQLLLLQSIASQNVDSAKPIATIFFHSRFHCQLTPPYGTYNIKFSRSPATHPHSATALSSVGLPRYTQVRIPAFCTLALLGLREKLPLRQQVCSCCILKYLQFRHDLLIFCCYGRTFRSGTYYGHIPS